jgi:hypothetical protein
MSFLLTKGPQWRCSLCNKHGVNYTGPRHLNGPRHRKAVAELQSDSNQMNPMASAAAAAVAVATAAAAVERDSAAINNTLTPARAVAAAALSSIASASGSSSAAAAVVGEKSNSTIHVPPSPTAALSSAAATAHLAVVHSSNVSPFMLSPSVMGMVRAAQARTRTNDLSFGLCCRCVCA